MPDHKYTVSIGGATGMKVIDAPCKSVKEGRLWAEEYGNTADWCEITNLKGCVVAAYHMQEDRWVKVCHW